jgi:hypothetical protein
MPVLGIVLGRKNADLIHLAAETSEVVDEFIHNFANNFEVVVPFPGKFVARVSIGINLLLALENLRPVFNNFFEPAEKLASSRSVGVKLAPRR